MSKETLVFVTGILLTVVPFLGVPETWRQYAILGAGAILIIVGYGLRRAMYLRRMDTGDGERSSDSFVETTERLFK